MAEYKWLKNYDPQVPHSLEPYPQKTLIDYLDEAVTEHPDYPMLLFKKNKLSYAEVQKLSDEFAAVLVELGVKKGDRVALIMPNCPQCMIGRFGAWKAGAVLVHLNPVYTEPELEHALKDCGATVAVVMTPFYNLLKKVQPRTAVKTVIATSIKEYLPEDIKPLFEQFVEKQQGHFIEAQAGDLWMQDVLAKHAGAKRPNVKVLPSDYALILFSGGTTGTPKGVVGDHYCQVVTGLQFQNWFGGDIKSYEDVIMAVLPFFHSFGTFFVMCMAIVSHMAISLVPNPRDVDDVIATIQNDRPAFFPAVPTMYIMFIDHPTVKAGKVEFNYMKGCLSGGAPLMLETKQRFEELTGARIVEGYALTESTMAACATPFKGVWKQGSVGMPLPDIEVRIGDLETGQGDMPVGKEGEIVMKAPQLMVGYWNRPEETKEMLRDGWLYTGDVAYMDDDGYIFITSRKKDLIKPSGFQVWPREVEEVICSHPSVLEAAVAGIPDARQGEAVKAWVVLQTGSAATVDEILAFSKDKLAPYKVPKFLEFRDALPKTNVGKVLRRVLVEEEAAKSKK